MRRWWASAAMGDRIAVVGIVITMLGVIPAYLTLFGMNRNSDTSPATQTNTPTTILANVPTTISKIQSARNRLLRFPDNDFSDTCGVEEDDDLFQDDLAYVFCSPDPSMGLSLAVYDTTLAMNSDFNGYSIANRKDSVPVQRGTSNCRSGQPSKGAWAYRDDPERNLVGRFICYIDNTNSAWIAWTYDKHKILAIAARDDQDLPALYKWWEKHWSARP
jgi:hypothetical protein